MIDTTKSTIFPHYYGLATFAYSAPARFVELRSSEVTRQTLHIDDVALYIHQIWALNGIYEVQFRPETSTVDALSIRTAGRSCASTLNGNDKLNAKYHIQKGSVILLLITIRLTNRMECSERKHHIHIQWRIRRNCLAKCKWPCDLW